MNDLSLSGRADLGEHAALGEGFALGGGVAVGGVESIEGAAEAARAAVADGTAAKLAAKDPTLWGPDAREEAAIRLGWLDLPESSRALLPRLARLRGELAAEGLTRVVLAGMGGSSLAPEVMARTLGTELTVLDTTDPHQVGAALANDLEHTVVVVSSKSGSTVETDSHRRAYLQAFVDSGLSQSDAGRRFVIVTDPGSPLEATAREMGAREVFLADPDVGGRYSALSAFGLVPAALSGVDVAVLLEEAAEFAKTLPEGGPALALGAALGTAANSGRDKLILAEDGSGVVGLGDWAEQLIAESTGKSGKGILPVVVENPRVAEKHADDVVLATIGGAVRVTDTPGAVAAPDLTVNGPLGAQFLAWEYATAYAGVLLGIDPFNQPNVAESKENTNRILADGLPRTSVAFIDGAVEVYADPGLLSGATGVRGALAALLGTVDERGYLAVMAYLDRVGDAAAAELRALLGYKTTRPVTWGWGPRFLHSTGQYHKGGPANGTFLQITGAVTADVPVAGKPYGFGALQAAQAAGDLQALATRGRPVMRLHLTDRAEGISQLLEALR